ncbi:ZIP family metal transporter [Erythrobacter sp. WG]|uniref:ZIP family metal transporter n=1 Tax=Erythrobacter sp. WG TaxID=2985510 RepID=UPI0022704A84|nr:ZIP family metal transporter [Erythrobacter sp. WG]MCX9147053.1 ZIP family metal transporter [Erythrobacter sp. WG]
MSQAAFLGLAASLLAGAMTGIGGLLVAASGPPDPRRQNLLIGFAAGVMIAAAMFSLILPAWHRMLGGGASPAFAALAVLAAVCLGALAMGRLGVFAEALAAGGRLPDRLGAALGVADERRVALFALAITLHNLPEGAAVGISFMGGDAALGWATALGIGLQNIPEGMAVAALLASLGWSRTRSTLAALASGLVEPLGGALAVTLAGVSAAMLPWALGFAAGAMLFVVVSEIIPHTRRQIAHGSATPALMAGLALMMVLDVTLS